VHFHLCDDVLLPPIFPASLFCCDVNAKNPTPSSLHLCATFLLFSLRCSGVNAKIPIPSSLHLCAPFLLSSIICSLVLP
jgi:hypothetical protein